MTRKNDKLPACGSAGYVELMDIFYRLASSLTAAHVIAGLLLIPAPVVAQAVGESPIGFSLVRSFSSPNLPVSNFESELFRKTEGLVTLPDVVDLNLKFSEEHGKPTILPPQFAPKTSTIILRFPDGWLTTTMVRSDGQGSFICRFKFKMVEPAPARSDFDKYVDWCHGMLTAGSLDPSLVSPP